jgi:hypothetical protein
MEHKLHEPGKDWLLATLNAVVNNHNITIGITITANGFMISGHLAGGKDYFEAIGNEFTSILKSGNVEDNFLELADRIYNSDSDHIKNGPLTTDYIHIKNAKFYNAGNSLPYNEAVWWRGKISEVSGFTLGVIRENN